MERPGPPGSPAQGEPEQTQHRGASLTEPGASRVLLQALTEVQAAFIEGKDARALFGQLLKVLMELTQSQSGFIAEVVSMPGGPPQVRAMASGPLEREVPPGATRPLLDKLVKQVLASGQPVVDDAPAAPTEGHLVPSNCLGLPFHSATELVGLVALADRPGGYDAEVIAFLRPVLTTCRVLLQGLRDVQRRGRAEEEQRRLSDSFRLLIERSREAIFVHEEGVLLFANRAAMQLLGQPDADPPRGRALEDFVLLGIEDMRQGSREGGLFEVHLRRADGQRVVGEGVTVPLIFDGRPSMVCIVRDITERLQVQERLRITERMVSLGTLAAGVAHEINNPLAYLMSNLHYVHDELAAMVAEGESLASTRGEELREALQEALAGSHRVRDIVRDLKLFSRNADDSHGLVDVRGVLDSCVNMAWSEIRHRARLEKDYGEVPPVEANESRLGQIFLNLLVNAAQAIHHGDARENEIRITTRHEGHEVLVAIRDTGGGIAPEHLGRLFEPFFTTKPVGVGTGLGLSICHGIVTGMGGRITVDSALGKGTTFRVFLPLKRPSGVPA